MISEIVIRGKNCEIGERREHEHNANNTRIERETILYYFRFVLSLNPGIVHNVESLVYRTTSGHKIDFARAQSEALDNIFIVFSN